MDSRWSTNWMVLCAKFEGRKRLQHILVLTVSHMLFYFPSVHPDGQFSFAFTLMVKATQGYSTVLEYSTACYETICKAYTSHQSLFYCNILMILWYVAHHKYLANNGHKTYPICNLLKPVLHTWDTWSRSRANPKHTEAVQSVPKPLCHMSFGTMDPKQFRGRNPSLPWFMEKISVQMTKFVDL